MVYIPQTAEHNNNGIHQGDRCFNGGVGKRFRALSTTLIFPSNLPGVQHKVVQPELANKGFLYLGLSDVVPDKVIREMCKNSSLEDRQKLHKKIEDFYKLEEQLLKTPPAKRRKFKAKYKKMKRVVEAAIKDNNKTMYNVSDLFVDFLIKNEFVDALEYFMGKLQPEFKKDKKTLVHEWMMWLHEDNPTGTNLMTLNPTRNYEDLMGDSKLMFFIENTPNAPMILAVLYNERQNYYGLDDLHYYEFGKAPSVNAFDPACKDEEEAVLSMVEKQLKGSLLRIPQKDWIGNKYNGADRYEITTSVVSRRGETLHITAHTYDNLPSAQGQVSVVWGDKEIKSKRNEYSWNLPITEATTYPDDPQVMDKSFFGKPAVVALSSLVRRQVRNDLAMAVLINTPMYHKILKAKGV
jgi:hypothetical protein